MRLVALLAVLVATGCDVALARAESKFVASRDVSGWSLDRFDARGRLSFCAVFAPQVGENLFGLSLLPNGTGAMSMTLDGLTFPDRAPVDVAWQAGAAAVRKTRGEGDSSGTVTIEFGAGSGVIDELRAARSLRVEMAGRRHEFALPDADFVMRELERCISSGGANVVATPAATGAPPRAPASADLQGSRAAAADGEEYDVGRWTMQTARDEGGKFQYCTAALPTINDLIFALRLTETRNWTFLLFGRGSGYPVKQVFDFAWRVDNLPPRRGRGVQVTGLMMNLNIDDHGPIVDELRRGRYLRLRVARHDYEFSLEGSAAAMTELERCVAVGLGGGAVPSPAAPSRRPSPQTMPALPSDADLPVETPASER